MPFLEVHILQKFQVVLCCVVHDKMKSAWERPKTLLQWCQLFEIPSPVCRDFLALRLPLIGLSEVFKVTDRRIYSIGLEADSVKKVVSDT